MSFEAKTIAVPDYDRVLAERAKLYLVVQAIVVVNGVALTASTIPWLRSVGLEPWFALVPALAGLWIFQVLRKWSVESLERRQTNRRRTAGREIMVDDRRLRIAAGLIGHMGVDAADYVDIVWTDLKAWQVPNQGSPYHRLTLASRAQPILIPASALKQIEAELLDAVRTNLGTTNAESPSAAQPEVASPTPRRPGRRIAHGLAVWLLVIASIYLYVACAHLHVFAAELTLLAYTALILVPLVVFMKKQGSEKSDSRELILTSTTLFLLINLGLRAVNVYGDRRPAQTLSLVIEDHFIRTDKGNRHYITSVRTPPLPTQYALDLHEATEHGVSGDDFARIEPGRTKLNLRYKMGFLGLPYHLGHSVDRSSLVETGPPRPKVKPVAWEAEVITTSPAAVMREDRWPNGRIRSREPVLDGRVQGIGEYTHANGRTYARIPWKNGQKHGRFKLYREDGTLESELSYKDGQPHGTLRWYDARGDLSREVDYVDGQPQ